VPTAVENAITVIVERDGLKAWFERWAAVVRRQTGGSRS
jgi:hypothetical protein